MKFFSGRFIGIVVLMLLTTACGPGSTPVGREVVSWHTVGAWSGHGDRQTESFTSDSGTLRVRWETRDESGPTPGVFRLTIHSAISGRPLEVAVDHRGGGGDTVYIHEDPRMFHAVVESADLAWSFTVEEAIISTLAAPVEVTGRKALN